MSNRKVILALSVLIAVALHALLFAVAPYVTVIQAHAMPRKILERFRVELVEAVWEEQAESPDPERSELASQPGSVSDLLGWDGEALQPGDSAFEEVVEVPGLEDRVASEEIERTYELEPDEEVGRTVDAKILEIDAEVARQGITVARRLVRPSPNRILGPDELPTLRRPEPESDILDIRFGRLGPGLLGGGDGTDEGKVVQEKPPYEPEVLRPEVAEPDLPVLQIEQVVARAPVRREAEAARQESPYVFMDDLVDIRLDSYIPPDEDRGYFRLQVRPKKDVAIESLPKDVTFVVDASNSIHQRKLDVTARGIHDAIAQMSPEDRFNIVAFRDSGNPFREGLVPATEENKRAAERFLKDMKSRGETDVYQAILPVVQTPPRPGVPGVVFVVSDGRPTAGMRDGRIIINGLTGDNKLQNSIFAFGGGRTVNRYLLELLAYRNKGASHVSQNLEDIDEDLPRFFSQLSEPLLVDLRADYGRLDQGNVFPSILPDFYRDRAVTVYGRFDPEKDKDFVMRLAGQAGERKKEVIFREDLREAQTGDRDIARGWAFEKSYYLIGEISRQGEKPELLGELRALGNRYNIRTSYSE